MSNQDDWLVNYKKKPAASLLLYCLPYAGGSAGIYRAWGDMLPSWIELWAIELPGRGTRWAEATVPDILTLSELISPILARHIDRPFAIFGHSMGGLIGYETTKNLIASAGKSPERLFISGCSPPHRRDDREITSNLADDEFISILRTLNGTPPEILEDAEIMELTLPILRADFLACDEYRTTDNLLLPCSLSAYGGLADPKVHPGDLKEWKGYTTGQFSLKMFEGDHFFLRNSLPTLIYNVGMELSSSLKP